MASSSVMFVRTFSGRLPQLRRLGNQLGDAVQIKNLLPHRQDYRLLSPSPIDITTKGGTCPRIFQRCLTI